MMKKIIIFLFLPILLLTISYKLPTVYAATLCGTLGNRPLAAGLVTSPQFESGSQFYTSSGACVVDPKAAFVPYNIPTYDSLKSLYYDQAKVKPLVTKHAPINNNADQTDISLTQGTDHIYYVRDNLNISAFIGGTQNAIVFVGGDLNIGPITGPAGVTCNIDNYGVVFIVRGNVNIDQSVNTFNGLIIAEGKNGYAICTAAFKDTNRDWQCPNENVPAGTVQQLVVNGSLISLNDANPIKFRRNLADNNQAAEQINHQVKYLVILRDLLSDTSLKWGEIDASAIIPPQAPHISIPLPPAPPSNNNPSACDITYCHAAYAYTSPGSCVPNDATCAATFNQRTCTEENSGIVTADCTDQCTDNPHSCYTGLACSKTGTCPNNYYPQTISNCDINGGCTSTCSQTGCGTLKTYYNGAQCDTSNCTPTSTQPSSCPTNSSGAYICYEGTDKYYHNANTCNSTLCPHLFPDPGSCPTNTCHGAYYYASGLTCNTQDTLCASNTSQIYANNQSTSCTADGCTNPAGGGTRDKYTSGSVCASDDADCPLTDTSSRCTADGCSTACNNTTCGTPITYHTGGSCAATGCTISNSSNSCPGGNTTTCYDSANQYYHLANTCGATLCPHNLPNPGSCPTNTCHGAYNYASGLSCNPTDTPCSSNTSSQYPNNQSTSCTADGCTSPSGGTQDKYTSGGTCGSDDANCPLADTKLSQCPNTNGTYDSCYNGPEKFYHTGGAGGSCTAIACPRTFPTPGSCPTNTCHGASSYASGLSCDPFDLYCASTTASFYPNNQASSCTTDGCTNPAGGTRDKFTSGTVCASDDADCPLTDTSSRCTADGCSSVAGGTRITYHTGGVGGTCVATNCPLTDTQASQCPATCHTNPIYYHTGGANGTCTAQLCNYNYLNGGISNQATACAANGGCTLATCTTTGCGSASSYTPANSCSADGACTPTSTLNECPAACYEGAIYKHAANTCAATKCNNNYYYDRGIEPSTSCAYKGCTTLLGSANNGVQDYKYFPNRCTKDGCSISSTEPDLCPAAGTCYDYPDRKFHPAGTCASTGTCPHNFPDPNASATDKYFTQAQCDRCGGVATTYYTGNQCGAIDCPWNYPPPTTPPSCRASNNATPAAGYVPGLGWKSAGGNVCSYSYVGANCGTQCGGGSVGGDYCYTSSRINVLCQYPLYFSFTDTWTNPTTGATITSLSSSFGGDAPAPYKTDGCTNYSCGSWDWNDYCGGNGTCALDVNPNYSTYYWTQIGGKNVDGVVRTPPGINATCTDSHYYQIHSGDWTYNVF